MDAQMKKGVLEMCILHLIADKEHYGYEIMGLVNHAFPEMNESTIYAVLKRLQKEGSADVHLGKTSGGPPRKYYFITTQGKEKLAQFTSNWHALSVAVQSLGID